MLRAHIALIAVGAAVLIPRAVLAAQSGEQPATLAASAPAAVLPASAVPPASVVLPASAVRPASAARPASAPAAMLPASTALPASAVLPGSAVFPASAVVPASAVPAAAPSPSWIPTIPPLPVLNVIDAPRNYLSQQFVDFVSGVDRFFGNDRNYQETNDSVLQFDLTRVVGYTGVRHFVLQGRAKVHLPNTEKRLHLLIESNPDVNAANATSQIQVNQPVSSTQTPSSYGAGVRLERAAADQRWHIADDLGLKFAGLNTSPFARLRGSYAVPIGDWRMNAAQTFFWFNTTGPGETTQLDFERTLSEPLLFRASSNGTWTNVTQQLDLRQDMILFQKVDERTAMQYQASVIGMSDPRMQSHVTDYVLLMAYRHRLHRKWMYLEISPQLHFPEARSYRSSGMLTLRLEILFDRSR